MPLVAHTNLPSFQRLREEGEEVLSLRRARHQDIRALHIGLLNMMPDKALEATERQFFRLVGACNQISQFYVHPFTIPGLPRGAKAQAHIDRYYEPFEKIRQEGLDALIISGANVTGDQLEKEAFWQSLLEVFSWARHNVTSVLCSCLATHAIVQHLYGIRRTPLDAKRWGVFAHQVIDRRHPLTAEINTRFDVPHSRFNEIFRADLEAAGLRILVTSDVAGVHLATSPDGFRIVFFQGHPEYDDISLLKEYKREVQRFHLREIDVYPPFPDHYFNTQAQQLLAAYQQSVIARRAPGHALPPFPETELLPIIDITWRDTARAVFNNWLGKIYQITHQDRNRPFMPGIDPDNPLNL
ncbi:MAG: homoserine O-succinyltransferase [Methylococcales bacterium]|nr:homoserine O-succinyltransferase [Methylococcales bacterium]